MHNSHDEGGCSSRAPYALMVHGDYMQPEFLHGTIIIVDPDHPHSHGSYVVADYDDDVYFRKLEIREQQAYLVPLNDQHPEIKLVKEYQIRGVITQQARNRKLGVKKAKHYT